MMLEPRPAQTVGQPTHEAGRSVAPLGIDDEPEIRGRFSPEEQRQRRARFGRYVRWTMGACVALSLAGLARRFVVDRDASADEPARASESFTTPTVAAGQPPSAPPPTVEMPPPAAAPAVVASAPDPKEAKREKKAAKTALDKGKSDAAIAAATRSTSLDPTDAETWLVLGAAYMEKRDVVSARHAFTDCGKNATHGPKNECAAMLR